MKLKSAKTWKYNSTRAIEGLGNSTGPSKAIAVSGKGGEDGKSNSRLTSDLLRALSPESVESEDTPPNSPRLRELDESKDERLRDPSPLTTISTSVADSPRVEAERSDSDSPVLLTPTEPTLQPWSPKTASQLPSDHISQTPVHPPASATTVDHRAPYIRLALTRRSSETDEESQESTITISRDASATEILRVIRIFLGLDEDAPNHVDASSKWLFQVMHSYHGVDVSNHWLHFNTEIQIARALEGFDIRYRQADYKDMVALRVEELKVRTSRGSLFVI
jgi:hypothetical protein